jgi:hypothetical protein
MEGKGSVFLTTLETIHLVMYKDGMGVCYVTVSQATLEVCILSRSFSAIPVVSASQYHDVWQVTVVYRAGEGFNPLPPRNLKF